MATAVDARMKGGYAQSKVPCDAISAIRFGRSFVMIFPH
jgi:hypothetical protein